jgi:hypothetical protein
MGQVSLAIGSLTLGVGLFHLLDKLVDALLVRGGLRRCMGRWGLLWLCWRYGRSGGLWRWVAG